MILYFWCLSTSNSGIFLFFLPWH